MKVLHTIPGLSLVSGGPSICTYNLLKGLRLLGIDAEVLTFESDSSEIKTIGGDPFIKQVKNDCKTPLLYSVNYRHYLQNTDYELYHANALWTLPSHETLQLAHKRHRPFVLATHGMLYPQALAVSKWRKKIIYELFQKDDLNKADCLQATCMAEASYIRELGIHTPVAIVPNCLDINLSIEPRKKVNTIRRIGFVGRLHPIKNLEALLMAWSGLGGLTNEAELLIVGCGDENYESKLKQFAYEKNLHNVFFAGFLSGNELQEMIHSFDYLVLPSKSENFGMVVPEALMNGVPVIASSGTPWEELNTHHCGWWKSCEVESLLEVLKEALSLSESERQIMGGDGRRLVLERYSMMQVAERMKKLYEWLLGTTISKPDFVV